MKEEPINDEKKEINEEKNEEKEKEKNEKMREKNGRKLRVSWLVRRRRRQFQLKEKRCHIPWYPQRKTRSDI